MQEMFPRCIVKVQLGTNFRGNISRKLNKIVTRICMQYYYKCWIHRNEAYHNLDIQRTRVELQYTNVKKDAKNKDYL